MRVPFQNLMEETKRKSSMPISQSNSRYCSSSKSRDSEKVMMKYSRMAMRILAELPSVRITCIVHKFFNDITHIQNIAVLSCPSHRNAIHGDGRLHYKSDEQVIQEGVVQFWCTKHG